MMDDEGCLSLCTVVAGLRAAGPGERKRELVTLPGKRTPTPTPQTTYGNVSGVIGEVFRSDLGMSVHG